MKIPENRLPEYRVIGLITGDLQNCSRAIQVSIVDNYMSNSETIIIYRDF